MSSIDYWSVVSAVVMGIGISGLLNIFFDLVASEIRFRRNRAAAHRLYRKLAEADEARKAAAK